jgi:uncharacterized membrane protein YeiH
MPALPDLATHTPLWLSVAAVAVNALVGALHGMDESHHWDIVGVSVFALLMGLGGGFIRDLLLGNLPAESLRSSRYLVTVLASVVVALAVGEYIRHVRVAMAILDTVALGLFAVTGTAYALDHGLPVTSAALVGTASAVGGGMLVSVVRGEVPQVLVASAPNALLAVFTCVAYVAARPLSPTIASFCAIAALLIAHYVAWRLGLRTRPIIGRS